MSQWSSLLCGVVTAPALNAAMMPVHSDDSSQKHRKQHLHIASSHARSQDVDDLVFCLL